MLNINYDWYKVFHCVAELGNITLASEQLFISQPAVSQSVKQLEKSVGCKLFIRSSKGVRLTAEGETLYSQISKGIAEIKTGEKMLKSLLSLESGEIHIGASDMTLEYYLLPYLEKYHRLYPHIKISITNVPTPQAIKLLEQNEIDFGVISEPIADIEEFSIIPVKQIEDIFIGGSEFCELSKESIPPSRLEKLPLILLENNTSTRKYINSFFKQNSLEISPEFELATSSLIVQFAKRNLGVGCVVRDFAKECLKNGSVNEIKLKKTIPPRNVCLVKNNIISSKASQILIDLLLENLHAEKFD